MRKVNGLVNPADLFTKHLSSRDRVTQLVELFNCEYREGRATTAPLLRKEKTPDAECRMTTTNTTKQHDNDGVTHSNMASNMASNIGVGVVDTNNLSPSHDPDVLPHAYAADDMESLFPVAVAPEDAEGIPRDVCICCRPGCGRCYPRQKSGEAFTTQGKESW